MQIGPLCAEAAEKVAGTDEGFGMKVARRRRTAVEGSRP